MKVLVTGGAGFVGVNLVKYLLDGTDWGIHVLDNLSESIPEEFDKVKGLSERVVFYEGDIRNRGDVMKAIEGCEYVVNLAAQTGVYPSVEDPYKDMDINVRGILNVLSVDIDVMVKASADMVKAGKPVWFGADAGKYSHRDMGVFNEKIYDFRSIYGTDCDMDKAARLDYRQSRMGHAMVFTAVDIDDDGEPTAWRVENSWGTGVGDKGFYTMTTEWFKEYNFEVVVEKEYIPEELLEVLETKPIVLPPWDPMGALAD